MILLGTACAVGYIYRAEIAAHWISTKIEKLTGAHCVASVRQLQSFDAEVRLTFPDYKLTIGPMLVRWRIESFWRRQAKIQLALKSEGSAAEDISLGAHNILGSVAIEGLSPQTLELHAEADWVTRGKSRMQRPVIDVALNSQRSSASFSMLVDKKHALTISYAGTPLPSQVAAGERLAGEGPLTIIHPLGKLSAQLKWSADLAGERISTELRSGAFTGLGRILEFTGRLDWHPPDWDVRFETHLPGDTSKAALWNPARVSLAGSGPYPKIKGQGKLLDLIGSEILPFHFEADADEPKVSMDVRHEWTLDGGFDLSRYSGKFTGTKFTGGKMPLKADVHWTPKGLRAHGTLAIDDASGEASSFPFTGLKTKIEMTSLAPLRIRPFRVEVASAGGAAPFEGIDLDVSLDKNRLAVVAKEIRWVGGRLNLLPTDINLKDMSVTTDVTLQELDLQTLLQAGKVSYIAAKGKISGKLPVTYRDDYLSIRGAKLVSENGWLRYADTTLKMTGNIDTMEKFQQLVSQGQQALVMKALDNFEYKKLEADITRNKKDGLSADLQIAGRNPNLARGQPFQFNISLAGQLEELVKRSLFLMNEE